MKRTLFTVALLVVFVGCTPSEETPATLLQAGGDTPKYIRLAWNDDPSTTASVVWYTEEEVVGPAVEHGAGTGYGASSKAESFQIEGMDGYFHEATLKGLEPGSLVHYRVGSKSGISPDLTFAAAPRDAAPAQIRFVLQGDSRSSGIGVGASFTELNDQLEKEAPAFVLDSGDYTFMGQGIEWADWLAAGEKLNSGVPRLTAFGNHEVVEKNYFALMSLPPGSQEKFYTLTYGPIQIFCLYTGLSDKSETDSDVTAWLKKELAASEATWKVAFFHMPPYNAGNHSDKEINFSIRENWVPLFEEYGVDVVASGHDHNYQNFGFLKGGDRHGTSKLPLAGDGTAPLYIISGGAGAPLYGYDEAASDAALVLKFEEVENYVLATVEGDKMTLEAKRIDGTVFDTITIQK